jgi:DNA-binding NarL/FixJ family response regulator
MKNINLIIADDHKLFRKGLVSILTDYPEIGEIIEVENGQQVLDSLAFNPDVILLDLEMPELDGLETLQRIREKNEEVKILVISMHTDEKVIFKALEMGCNGYLQKNCDPEELLTAIHRCINHGKYVSEKVSHILWDFVNVKKEQDSLDLTEREKSILSLICKEYTSTEIADILCMSARNVDLHRQKLMEKLNVKSTIGLVKFAIQNGFASSN